MKRGQSAFSVTTMLTAASLHMVNYQEGELEVVSTGITEHPIVISVHCQIQLVIYMGVF
jgi:hypothetical protein